MPDGALAARMSLAENASAVIATSDFLASEIRRKLSDVDLRLEIVRAELAAAASYELLSAGHLGEVLAREPFVVLAGTLVPRHGVATLLNAAAIVESMHPALRTVIVGDGPQADELRQQAERLGLTRVHFLGMRSRVEARSLFACGG